MNSARGHKHPNFRAYMQKYRAKIGPAGRIHELFMTRLSRYGLTLDQYHAMAERQDFGCAICQREPKKVVAHSIDGFHVDHCHETGRVRGLLCPPCNQGLGLIQNAETLRSAAAYVDRAAHPARLAEESW